jgi:hypothetical protein
MATSFYRAMATVKFLQKEIKQEREAHAAMKLCFKKIHASLDLYKGHFINRLRFHMNRHHTEYVRKVRSIEKLKHTGKQHNPPNAPHRASLRVGVASSMAAEIERLQCIIAEKSAEIERLCALVDDLDGNMI